MIKNIVFDMGQVLIRWRPDLLIAHYALSAEDEALLNRELFQSVEWVQTDHGTLTGTEAAESVCRRLPERLYAPVRELCERWWERPLVPMPGMGELVAELKAAGYGIYLLSNANRDLRKYFHRIPGSECFDGLLVSAEEQLLKPQHEIYHALYRRFELKPEECFFVDDNPSNVEGALCTGMAGTIFRGDADRLRRELEDFGILREKK